mmetsp:Transcript_20120/g.43824  ORF Transcript_20120/g.43824 Transcript_20120/m.43824 type:complete len:207 (-) Transcript_20120:1646-2266(-)
MRYCALSDILIALLRIVTSLMPDPARGSAMDNERPRDMDRDLLLCMRFFSSPSTISASSPSAARDRERSRLRPRDCDLNRSTALLVSIPMAPRDFCILSVVSCRSARALLGSTAWLFALFFFSRWAATSTVLRCRIAARSAACSSVRSSSSSSMSSSLAYWASSSASSRSSSASLASMSGSMKSRILWPSMISGIRSYFHSSLFSW